VAIACLLLFAVDVQAKTGGRRTFMVSGSVGESGVMLNGFVTPVQSDFSGNFTAEVNYGWRGTITPVKPGYTFEPASRSIDPVKAPISNGIVFTPSMQTFVIAGTVSTSGVVLQGFPQPEQVDNNGHYSVVVPYGFTATITPVKEGYKFVPGFQSYNNLAQAMPQENYRAEKQKYEISGVITVDGSGAPFVTLKGLPGNPRTSSNGSYKALVDHNWSGTVIPDREGMEFDPPSRPYDPVTMPYSDQSYYGKQLQYQVSGNVGQPGVQIRGLPGVIVSNTAGDYTAYVTHGENTTIIPFLLGYDFSPPSKRLPKVVSDLANQDFIAKEKLVTIKGYAGSIAGVVLDGLEDRNDQPVITKDKGYYEVQVRHGFSGGVAPIKEGYTFKPSAISYNNLTINKPADNYVATMNQYQISGNVRIPEAVLRGFPGQVLSQHGGNYSVLVPYNWTGKVTPVKAGYQFTPEFIEYPPIKQEQPSQNYEAGVKQHRIAGTIIDEDSALPVEQVLVMTGIDTMGMVETDNEGRFELKREYGWEGTVEFVKDGYDFVPIGKPVPNLDRDITLEIKAKMKMIPITDRLTDEGGNPFAGVLVVADPGGHSDISNAQGLFTVKVPYGWTGKLDFRTEEFIIEPSLYEYVVEAINEIAPVTPPSPNPVPENRPPYVGPPAGVVNNPIPTRPPDVYPPVQPGNTTMTLPNSDPVLPPESLGPPPSSMGNPPVSVNPELEAMKAQYALLREELNLLRSQGAGATANPPSLPNETVSPGSVSASPYDGLEPYVSEGDFQGEEIVNALSDMALNTRVTIIADPDVQGMVMADVSNLPLNVALDTLLAGTGYSWRKLKHYYLVSGSSPDSPGFIELSDVKRVKLGYVQAVEAVNLLSDAFKQYVKPESEGRSVIITAPLAIIDRIEMHLRTIDIAPRQVLLDARVVVMEKGDLLNLGIEWGWPSASIGTFRNAPMEGVSTTGQTYSGDWPWSMQFGLSSAGAFTSALTASLKLLEENGEAQIVSSPQVFAMDGRTATIHVITEEYYMLTPPTDAAGAGLYSRAELETIESGSKLDIIPFISDTNEIVMEIAVELSDSIPSGRGSGLPVVTRRLARNTVTVQDGGTVALAGLSENHRNTKDLRTPGLSKIPLIGNLFNSTNRDSASRDVAVFITARIVADGHQVPTPPEVIRYNPAPAAGTRPTGGMTTASPMAPMTPAPTNGFRDALGRRLSTTPQPSSSSRRPTSRY
jgi:hypothetical protein